MEKVSSRCFQAVFELRRLIVSCLKAKLPKSDFKMLVCLWACVCLPMCVCVCATRYCCCPCLVTLAAWLLAERAPSQLQRALTCLLHSAVPSLTSALFFFNKHSRLSAHSLSRSRWLLVMRASMMCLRALLLSHAHNVKLCQPIH